MAQPEGRQILPTNVKPVHYDLTLKPDLSTFVFNGQVKIDLEIKEDTKVIVLNVNDIKIHSAVLSSTSLKTESKQNATDISYDAKTDVAILKFEETLPANSKALLDITFEGALNEQLCGFYRSSYKDAEGNTKYIAVTQFEATDARRAFPCWDEPALKATFDITLVVSSELTALSNMNIISEKPYLETGKLSGKTEGKTEASGTVQQVKEVKFATTPPMSTYLVAFVVGPFEYIEAYTSGEHNGHPVKTRVYALPGSVEQGRLALNVATAAIEYFAKVFGEPYPLPKMDMIAIPDFEAGAMENWGLVTYRNVALLYDEKSSSIMFKKSVAYTVCHELAHQWFGNLVTMEWWEHLWLNEGFATWVGWLAVDQIFPEWDIWVSFVNEDMPRALSLDGLRSSHPIEVPVKDPAEIHQIFDAISYYKGASVIRMLSSWLGVDTFLAGVRRYLHKHKFGNASTSDLWAALSEEAGQDVSQFMTIWTKTIGYPVLNVEEVAGNCIKVTQSRYLSTGDLSTSEDNTLWWNPLGILTPGKTVEPLTLTEKSQTFDVPEGGLFKLNAGQTAVYRVNYPIEVVLRLAEEIKKGPDGILNNAADRVGLIADSGNLCVSGEQATTAFLELAQAFTRENDYFVLSQLSSHLSTILGVWAKESEEVTDTLKGLRRSLFGPLAHQLGWDFAENESYLTNMLRVLVLSNAGRSKDAEVVTEAKQRFWKYVEGEEDAIHPNMRGPVFGIVLSNADDEKEETKSWEKILEIYSDETLPVDQRMVALNTLGGAKSPDLIKRYLNMLLGNTVRDQDSFYVFRSLASNPDATELLWEFFKNNYEHLHEKYAKSLSLFKTAVRSAIIGFTSFEKIEEVEAFFADKETKEYEMQYQQAVEAARVNTKWLQRDRDIVADWACKHSAQFQ